MVVFNNYSCNIHSIICILYIFLWGKTQNFSGTAQISTFPLRTKSKHLLTAYGGKPFAAHICFNYWSLSMFVFNLDFSGPLLLRRTTSCARYSSSRAKEQSRYRRKRESIRGTAAIAVSACGNIRQK